MGDPSSSILCCFSLSDRFCFFLLVFWTKKYIGPSFFLWYVLHCSFLFSSTPPQLTKWQANTDKTQLVDWLLQLTPTIAGSGSQGCFDGYSPPSTRITSLLPSFPPFARLFPLFCLYQRVLLLSQPEWCKHELVLTSLFVIRMEWQSLRHDRSWQWGKGMCVCACTFNGWEFGGRCIKN